ncbi:hypothetical protein Pst134EA_007380 [Puccinia striiformis f. sp. tritici]|uniref:hypothetical protein n=1 Tax=Puccinia striiformis f. sp. tritici TaxID=168172 RepID=UPI002008534C|nr:hypothetical protein Pst134EA_007380 [Puccinia striiformis f. sp. tritici]KAH9470115.1 hypothetical protein Pst134EA_007380 [Puccinia striiformis f. sp. tritici]
MVVQESDADAHDQNPDHGFAGRLKSPWHPCCFGIANIRCTGQLQTSASPSGTRDLRRSSSAHSTVNQVAVADILQGCGRSLRRARSKPSFKGSSIFSCIQNRRDQAETRGPSRSQEANVAARASPSPIELENSNGRDEPGSPGKEGYSINTFSQESFFR